MNEVGAWAANQSHNQVFPEAQRVLWAANTTSRKSAKAQPFLASLQDAFLRIRPVPGVSTSLQPLQPAATPGYVL